MQRFYPICGHKDFAWRNQLVITVHPLPCNEAFAERPVGPGAAEVPTLRSTFPFDWFAVSRDTKMLSTLSWERAQLRQACSKLIVPQLSNMLAGNEVRLVQFRQASVKPARGLKFRAGNEVRLVQLPQAPPKLNPELRSKVPGNEVKLLQPSHAKLKLIPELRSKVPGKDVRLVQLPQAELKLVPELRFIVPGNEVKLGHPSQASVKSVTQKGFTFVLQKYGGWFHKVLALVENSDQRLHCEVVTGATDL